MTGLEGHSFVGEADRAGMGRKGNVGNIYKMYCPGIAKAIVPGH